MGNRLTASRHRNAKLTRLIVPTCVRRRRQRRIIRTTMEDPTNPTTSSPWNLKAVAAATTLCLGTVLSQLFYQHVSNAAPKYFSSIAVILPLSGLICYSSILVVTNLIKHYNNNNDDDSDNLFQFTWSSFCARIKPSIKYCIGIGGCFALHNILTDFGKSGSKAGVPDVSTVLSMVLQKLVVPVSLALESVLDHCRPTISQVSGVAVVMLGILMTALMYLDHHHQSDTNEDEESSSSQRGSVYWIKVFCLCISSVPLALGFYIVSVTRRNLPHVSGVELWAVLCIPELFFAIVLAVCTSLYTTFAIHSSSSSTSSSSIHVWQGIACVIVGVQPTSATSTVQYEDNNNNNIDHDSVHCGEAARFFWLGFPFSLALNIAIPVLVKLQGPTSVPLFRAMALPVATLLTMTNFDHVIYTPFSWNVVVGVLLCTTGLVLYYSGPIDKQAMAMLSGYTRVNRGGDGES